MSVVITKVHAKESRVVILKIMARRKFKEEAFLGGVQASITDTRFYMCCVEVGCATCCFLSCSASCMESSMWLRAVALLGCSQ